MTRLGALKHAEEPGKQGALQSKQCAEDRGKLMFLFRGGPGCHRRPPLVMVVFCQLAGFSRLLLQVMVRFVLHNLRHTDGTPVSSYSPVETRHKSAGTIK